MSNDLEQAPILEALRASVEHLLSVVELLSDAQLHESAYPAERRSPTFSHTSVPVP